MALSDKVWESFYKQFKVWVHFLIWTKKKHFFPHMDKEETKLHINKVWMFYTFSLDLKIWTYIFWKFSCFNFSERKGSTFAESKWYMYTLWLLITLCNMPKGLVTFWYHVIDTKGAILLVILLNKFVLVLFHSHLGMW